jgi:dual specificity MAP kinase phosphatase
MKGVVTLETHIPSPELASKITKRDSSSQKIVLYDGSSSKEGVKVELEKHAEVLCRTEHSTQSDRTAYFLNGGFDTFSAMFPEVCEKSAPSQKPRSPLGISVSSSLPITLSKMPVRQRCRSQTPLDCEDDASRFGPPIELLQYLVLGCEKDSSNLTVLRKMGVTAVLNVSHNCPNHFQTLFEYKTIPVEDSHHVDLLSKLQTAFDFINSIQAKGGRVFVHCHAGISRSATVCIAFIMKHLQMDLTKAYDFVKQKRPCISPNLHFMGQLLEFEKTLRSCSATEGVDNQDQEPMEHDTSTDSDAANTSSEHTQSSIITRDRELACLRLSLSRPGQSSATKSATDCRIGLGIKKKLYSASAPNSLDLCNPPSSVTESNSTSNCRAINNSNCLSIPLTVNKSPRYTPYSYVHTSTGICHRSSDGVVYHLRSGQGKINQLKPSNSLSLPSTPADSPYGGGSHPLLSLGCRLQNQTEQDSSLFGIAGPQETSLQMSPCRIGLVNK